MDFRTLALVPVLVAVVGADAHAQLAPGDSCLLKKPVKVTTKPKGKGKTLTLEPGSEITLEEVRGKWMKLTAGHVTAWLKRGKLKNKCKLAEPVFEEGTGFESEGTETEPFEIETETEPEPIETETGTTPADEIMAEPIGSEEPEPFVEEEPSEPEDEEEAADTGGERFWLGGLAGLGLGAQGGHTRLTFDLVGDFGWRLMGPLSLGARLFLHGTPGVGYGFGGLTAELRYHLPSIAGIEPYVQAGLGAGYGAAGTTTGVFVGRLTGGGRMFVLDRLYVNAEVAVIISQLSAAGLLDVGAGWSF